MEPAKPMMPIGTFRSSKKHSYEAARQAAADESNSPAYIELNKGKNFEQALVGLSTFSHIWLIYQFHLKKTWKPMVLPPRGQNKVGVFASRSPYRPNPIGISCVELVGITGRQIHVRKHDILDGTPILDIKPYLAYSDAVIHATSGWVPEENYQISFSEKARKQLLFLQDLGLTELKAFIVQQLSVEPTNKQKKRVKKLGERFVIAYRTWRVEFKISRTSVIVLSISSGYSEAQLRSTEDPYLDKSMHRLFQGTDYAVKI
jgi:tRNA (adenine37-N6)-methyltransferase